MRDKGEIVIYQTQEGNTSVEVKMDNDTVWLTQLQMAELFNSSRVNINEHIGNVYKENELIEESTCRKFRQVQKEGKRLVERDLMHYNLDVIISIGYRINSKQGTQFRIWATQRLKEHLVIGYTLNEKRLKQVSANLVQLEHNVKMIPETIEL